VKERRELHGWTQLDVATRGELSLDRVQSIESVRTDRYSGRTLSKFERGMRWEPGSVRSVLDGGDPVPMAQRKPIGTAYEVESAGPAGEWSTEEAVRRSGLSEETKRELLSLRELVARWVEAGDEASIRRTARVVRALDEDAG
jgi:hypothetical protein